MALLSDELMRQVTDADYLGELRERWSRGSSYRIKGLAGKLPHQQRRQADEKYLAEERTLFGFEKEPNDEG
jgi:hypothetical protein